MLVSLPADDTDTLTPEQIIRRLHPTATATQIHTLLNQAAADIAVRSAEGRVPQRVPRPHAAVTDDHVCIEREAARLLATHNGNRVTARAEGQRFVAIWAMIAAQLMQQDANPLDQYEVGVMAR